MNIRQISYLLGIVALLIGATMIFSIPWAFQQTKVEFWGAIGLTTSMIISLAVGFGLLYYGWADRQKTLYRKEAMAVVGLSWVLATILGALPYLLSGTVREIQTVKAEESVGADEQLKAPGQKLIPMNVADALFESQSGFSTTGATILTDIDNEELVPRSILFWRSSTHFLGGLGIIVLFVAILGQGSAGKTLMRAEMPGPTKDTGHARTQHAAWKFAGVYILLNFVLAIILYFEGMTIFEALCHAFGTMATGGFSTSDDSAGHFSDLIEATILVFMIIAGCNFTLIYFCMIGQPKKMLMDIEWRAYMAIIAGSSVLIMGFGLYYGDFKTIGEAALYGIFQVVSVITTTGFGTHDFDSWNSFGRGLLFLLMFIGGCAGSTGGGMKVIRHVLFLKILWLEIEKAYHPSVIRPIRLGGEPVEEQGLRHSILVYFSLVLVIFVFSWLALVTLEPDHMWDSQASIREKLLDCATAVAANLNNIGPGLGTIGATKNYAHFSWWGKILLTWLMMLGRLEIFVMLVLFVPNFWKNK